ncbi:MAG TPA: ribonuclease Y [Candidatus Hydrogenedentes bacterium]|nr:ribonuclease Y [Candidatus Hydrogenedentota bacterium]HOS02257.1 ribonuclease Y [Candidatus Hydrogenedentota bacterium]
MPQVYITVLWVVAGGLLGVAVTVVSARIAGRNLLGKARREAAQTISNAERDAASILKEANTSIKEQRIQLREETERETREQRKELVALEKRILAKEETVDKRVETLERKANDLNARERELGDREKALDTERDKIKALVDEQTTRLEAVSGMSAEEAKRLLFNQLETEVRRDTAIRLKRIEDEMVENSEKKAKWVITQAIQRCAADHVAEAVVSVVNLPNDEMKGRIIGREGRNIRVLEAATGINCIIDDTPEAVILSGFDPVRREIARISLERLIQDGRIHPARIEEVVQKVTEEMNQTIKENGERACLDTDIHGLHPEIVKLLGRLTYRTSYGQNVLRHSMEVCHLAGLMAAELGLPIHEAKRAALIHDIGKAINHEVEGSHAVIGHDLAKRYGENEHIANAIGSHHAEMEQSSVIAVLVQAADALSAARPGARRETLETYIKRLEQLEGIADGFSGVEKSYALQAGREIRVAVYPEKVTDAEASQLARDIARKVESEMTYPGQIKVTVIRETRAVDTAK